VHTHCLDKREHGVDLGSTESRDSDSPATLKSIMLAEKTSVRTHVCGVLKTVISS